MAHDTHIYREVKNKSDLKKIFLGIRHDLGTAHSRPALTELYKRAGYLITLTHAPAWEKFGREVLSCVRSPGRSSRQRHVRSIVSPDRLALRRTMTNSGGVNDDPEQATKAAVKIQVR